MKLSILYSRLFRPRGQSAHNGGLIPLYGVLLVLLVALMGAILNPIALFLIALPFNLGGFLEFLNVVKMFIANFLLWAFFCLVVLMVAGVVRGRWAKKNASRISVQTKRPGEIEDRADRPLKIAVAVTAYNHAQVITSVVEDFRSVDGVVEVIVVDNNSIDDTAQLARTAGAKVVRETRQGYGHACIRGLAEAIAVPDADVIVLTEGDGTFNATDLSKFRAYISQFDLVVGTRTTPGMVEQGSQMDYFFTWGNMFAGALLQLRFWEPQFLGAARLTDVGCTYRAIHREALRQILPELIVGGNHFSPHMLLVALTQGLSVIEIPITMRRRIGKSSGASASLWDGLKVGLTMIWHILTYKPRAAAQTPPRMGGQVRPLTEGPL